MDQAHCQIASYIHIYIHIYKQTRQNPYCPGVFHGRFQTASADVTRRLVFEAREWIKTVKTFHCWFFNVFSDLASLMWNGYKGGQARDMLHVMIPFLSVLFSVFSLLVHSLAVSPLWITTSKSRTHPRSL